MSSIISSAFQIRLMYVRIEAMNVNETTNDKIRLDSVNMIIVRGVDENMEEYTDNERTSSNIVEPYFQIISLNEIFLGRKL